MNDRKESAKYHNDEFNDSGSESNDSFFFILSSDNKEKLDGGACSAMVIVVGSGHGDTSSIPR